MSTRSGPLYLDTSGLLKLFFPEPESKKVVELLAGEERVVVSELVLLEAETQFRARLHGGLLTKARHGRLTKELERMLTLEPFTVVSFPADGFERARRLAAKVSIHCRTLDLLHVATMDALTIRRLLTNDRSQGSVASTLGLAVTTPRE